MSGKGMPAEAFTPTTIIMQSMWFSMGTLFILLVPLITMRLIAEEKRAGTIELLTTSPLSIADILLGKYIAAMTVYVAIIMTTLYMPDALGIFSQVNWGHVAAGYAGLILLGGAMMAVGLFASTVTEKQVVAAVISIGILVTLWFIGGGIGAANLRVTTFLRDVSLYAPFENMTRGLLDMRDLVVLVSYSVFMLFLSHRSLESGRW
jgi:ABC-2 type transport system permease protein